MEFVKSKVRELIHPPGTTPLNWKQFLNLFFSLFCSAMTISLLFPFLPAMIKSFGISDKDTGYYAGLVVSSMFIGRTLACYFWGWLADKVGRRPVMIISLSLLLASMLGFGFSLSLSVAILTRLFCGLSNGLVGTCKAMASEACDNTNQSLGMSVVLTAWNLGLIVGPAVGGFLAQPAEKYPNVFPKGSFFDQFAFLLPCLMNCVALLIATVLDYFYLEETLSAKGESGSDATEPGELLPMQSIESSDNQDDSNKEQLLVESETYTENTSNSKTEELAIFIQSDADGKGRANCQSGWCKNYCKGGLGFSTDQIGTALLCVAAPLVFLQIWVYPKFERRLGAIRVFQVSDAIVVIASLSLPFINIYFNRSTVLWPLLIGILLPNKLCTGMAFASTALFVNNTVPNNLLGSVNGLAMSAASISRALAPVIAGSAFAWSISHGFKLGFPLDEHFAFFILAIVCVLGIVLSCALPDRLNRRPTEPAKV